MKTRSGEKIKLTSIEELLGVPNEEVASEIENETEMGMHILGSLLSLSINLVKRQKEKLDETK